MATEDSEMGGHSGLIQPLPHVPLGAEAAFLERALDPADDSRGVAEVLADVLSGKYPNRPLPEADQILPLAPDVMRVQELASDNGFGFVGVGNKDTRTVRIKAALNRRMEGAVYGPEKQIQISIAPIIQLEIGVAPGHWFYQILMNNIQVTEVWEVDVA